MLRFVDIKNRILYLLDEAATSAVTATTSQIVTDAINAAHRRLCLSRSWGFMLWPREESFTTTAGNRVYALNQSVGKLLHVWDYAGHTYVPMVPRRDWESLSVDRTDQVDFSGIIFGGTWPVAVQPSVAATIDVVSSDALDVSKQVYIRGIDASGAIVDETVTSDALDGTTPVTSTNSYLFVLNLTKIGTWVGTVTLSTVADGTLATLTSAEYGKQHPTLEFVETPAGAKTFTYAFTRMPRTLSLDNDIPEIPFPHSEVLVYDALMEIATYSTAIGSGHVQLWAARRDQLLKQLDEAQDEEIVGAIPRFVRDLDYRRDRAVRFG